MKKNSKILKKPLHINRPPFNVYRGRVVIPVRRPPLKPRPDEN